MSILKSRFRFAQILSSWTDLGKGKVLFSKQYRKQICALVLLYLLAILSSSGLLRISPVARGL